MPDSTSSPDFDETKHPRGQPDNPGKFKRRLLPAPPLARRRRRHGPVRSPVSVEEIARDAAAKPEKCPLCHGYVVIVTPQPGNEPVEWCRCGDSLRNELGLPLVWEIVNEIVRQGRLPVPDCPYCGVRLECRDPSVHVQGLHGRECHACQHVTEDCEHRPDIDSDPATVGVSTPASSTTPAGRGSGELQEEAGSSEKSPSPKSLRKARAAERVATGAIVLSVSAATLGWSSTFEVQLMMWAAVAAVAVLTVRALPELRQRWREGTQVKHESDLLSELNGHLSRLVANAAEAQAAVKGFDEATEQSDQRTPERSKMADAMRRALVEEARERAAAAATATGRAQAAAVLPHPKRTDAIAELIKELEAAAP